MEAEAKHAYLSVLRACNTLVHNIGRNLWAKFVPNSGIGADSVNLEFAVTPGDNTPRRVMLCLARQVHNFKCVAKVLERMMEAEKFVSEVQDELETTNPFNVNMKLLTSLNSQVTMLTKCEAAMQRRQSVRHRVVSADASTAALAAVAKAAGRGGGTGVACFPLCDIDCSVLGLQLSQLDTLSLVDNSDPQWWLVEDSAGRRLRVPPLFLGIDAENGELSRIRRTKARLLAAVHTIHSQLAAQLLQSTQRLETRKTELMMLLQSEQQVQTFIYRLKIVDKFLRVLKQEADCSFSDLDFSVLRESVGFLMERVAEEAVPIEVAASAISADLLKLRAGLKALLQVASSQEAATRSRRRVQNSGTGSLRSGRSHKLQAAHRRTSVFEFEFEFLEKTKRVSTERRLRTARSVSDLSDASSEHSHHSGVHSETLTRQRQQIQRRFVIRSVWDGQREVSLQEAASSGLVNFGRGTYRCPDTRRDMPLEAAMAAGKIRVEFTSAKKLSEDTSSFGLIQLEEFKEVVDWVQHPDSGRRLGADEASACGLLDPSRQHVMVAGRSPAAAADSAGLQLQEARRRGIVATKQQPVVVSYVVHAVVDVRQKRRVTFQEAVQLNIVDKETGCFTNSSTGEILQAAEAIKHGFLKAYTVDDPKTLNIDPEHRISARRFQSLKNKWHAVNAFSRGLGHK